MSMDSQIGSLKVMLEGDASKLEAACDRANAKIAQVMERATQSGQAQVASNQKTVAALEGSVTAVQKMASSVDGLGATIDKVTGKSHTVWKAFGSAIGGETDTLIGKVLGFIDHLNKIPDAINAVSFASSQKSWLNTDEMRKANDLLEQQIAIMEKKPVNNVAIAMDELRIAADKAAMAAKETNEQIERTLSANHIAAWKVLLGQKGTANVEGSINSWNQQMQDKAEEAQIAAHEGDDAGRRRADRDLRRLRTKAIRQMTGIIDETEGDKEQAGRHSMALYEKSQMEDAQDAQDQLDRNQDDQNRQRRDQEKQRREAAAKAAAAAAEEARQKQYRDIMAGAEQQLADRKQQNFMPPGELVNFWVKQRNAQPQGSLAYADMNRKLGEAVQEYDRQTIADAQKNAEQIKRYNDQMSKVMDEMLHADREDRNSDRDLQLQRELRDVALEELGIRVRIGRTMTELDGARAMALEHEKAYAAELAALEAKLADVRSADDLKPSEKEAEIAALQKQIGELNRQHDVQKMQDRMATQNQPASFATGVRGAADQIADRYSDHAEAGREFIQGTLQAFDSSLTRMFDRLGQRGEHHVMRDFAGETIKNVGGSLQHLGLQQMEGAILKAFGFGKPDGTRGNPMWVRMDEVMKAADGEAASGIDALISKASGGGEDSGWGAVSSYAGSLLSGMLADGGPVESGSTYLVGERGPELFTSGSSGYVTPNHKLMSGNSSSRQLVQHISISGSQDPAQTRFAAQRGAAEGSARAMSTYGDAQQEARRRRPLSARD